MPPPLLFSSLNQKSRRSPIRIQPGCMQLPAASLPLCTTPVTISPFTTRSLT